MFNIYRTQDIQIGDVALRQQYYQNFFNGNVSAAQQIYESNEQLEGKCLNAEMLNKLLSSILTLEGYYDTAVPQYLNSQLNKLQLNINELILMGDWNASVQYVVNNFVSYDGEIYFCYQTPTIGTLPTDTDFWIYLGLRGKRGLYSLAVNYRGAWANNQTYSQYDMVIYQNGIYIAKQANSGQLPTNTTYWFMALEFEGAKIYCGETEPLELEEGGIWLKYVN